MEEDKRYNSLKEYRLEPLNIGEIVDQTIEIFRSNFKKYLLMTAIIYSPFIALNLISMVLFVSFLGNPGTYSKTFSNLMQLFIFLAGLISSICWLILLGATAKLTSEYYLGRSMSYKEAIQYSFGKFFKLLGTGFLVFLVITGVGVGVGILVAVLGALASMVPVVFILVALVVGAVGFYYIIILNFGLSLSLYTVILELKTGGDALKRSWKLFNSSKDARNKIIMVPAVLSFMLILVYMLPQMIAPQLGNIFSVFFAPLIVIAKTLVYFDIRIRTEGYDLEYRADRLAGNLQVPYA